MSTARTRARWAAATAGALAVGALGLLAPAVAGPTAASGTVTITLTGDQGLAGLDLYLQCRSRQGFSARAQENAVSTPADPCVATAHAVSDASGVVTFTGIPYSAEEKYVVEVYDEGEPQRYDSVASSYFVVGDGATVERTIAMPTRFRCTTVVSATGTAAVGQTLTASTPTFVGGTPGPLVYNWYRLTYANGHLTRTPVQGDRLSETSPSSATYGLVEADFGHQVQVDVHADHGTSWSGDTCDYNATAFVGRLGYPVSTGPSVTGKAKVKKTLTASPGAFAPGATVSYQWFRQVRKGKSVVIGDATAPTYRLTKRDSGKKVYVTVTYAGAPYGPSVLSTVPKKIR